MKTVEEIERELERQLSEKRVDELAAINWSETPPTNRDIAEIWELARHHEVHEICRNK